VTARDTAREDFVRGAGWAGTERTPVAGDASFRHYTRLRKSDATAILMDAPPENEDTGPFLTIAAWLAKAGYGAPRVLAADGRAGFVLLEDLGEDSFTAVLTAGADASELYGAAVDVLADLQSRPAPGFLPAFDETRILSEVSLFLDWYAAAALGHEVSASAREDFLALWRAAITVLRGAGECVALFDYHADNLHWLPDRQGNARVGLLDFQDAVQGPRPLDLVSLLEDARRDVDPDLAAAMIERYFAAAGVKDATGFRAAYAAIGAQRNTRIVGVFARLWLRDRKPGYLRILPRVWGHLERDLAHPALADLRLWFEEAIPASLRRSVPAAETFGRPLARRP
jgi:hypothetical protein